MYQGLNLKMGMCWGYCIYKSDFSSLNVLEAHVMCVWIAVQKAMVCFVM
jgi:hypothetical protein